MTGRQWPRGRLNLEPPSTAVGGISTVGTTTSNCTQPGWTLRIEMDDLESLVESYAVALIDSERMIGTFEFDVWSQAAASEVCLRL